MLVKRTVHKVCEVLDLEQGRNASCVFIGVSVFILGNALCVHWCLVFTLGNVLCVHVSSVHPG